MAGPGNLTINQILSGGLITNYACPCRCRHCLYRCGPERSTDYIDDDTARRNFSVIRALGCSSIHIGGGEPFLRVDRLAGILSVAREVGMKIEYVETNSSWYHAPNQASDILKLLSRSGLTRILVSISPFHNEYVPFSKIQGVFSACRAAGVAALPWVAELAADLNTLESATTHSLEEFSQRFGPDYLRNLPKRYRVSPGGRALDFLGPLSPRRSVTDLLSAARQGCRELANTTHFHLDLYGNYIPGLCAGLSIRREDLGGNLDPDRYPIISVLFSQGIRGFLAHAQEKFGFQPSKPDYGSKCELCDEIRRFVVKEKKIESPELQPTEFYF